MLGSLTRLGDRIAGRRRSLAFLVFGILAIVWWQYDIGGDWIYTPPDKSYAGLAVKNAPKWQVTAARGAQAEASFFFLYYHLGLYPLASDIHPREDTKAEAERLLEYPEKLKQEEGLTFRSGEHGRIQLYWVDALLRDRGLDPSLRPATALAFVLSLVLLFASAWWVGAPVLGSLLVLLLGSQLMQLHAVYREENFFSWPITTALLLLAIHMPLLVDKPARRWIWIAPVLAGLVLAAVRTIRSEPGALVLSAIGTYLFLRRVKPWKRLAAIALLGGSMMAGDAAYKAAIRAKMDHTRVVLQDLGGEPYGGPTIYHHEFWHAIWCGLGDFGTDRGYWWNDHAAYRKVVPILEHEAGHSFDIDTKGWFTKFTYGDDPRYRIGIWELPGYDRVVRDLVLDDIEAHPGWYAGILWKRTKRIINENTQPSIAVGNVRWTHDFPYSGLLCLPLLGWCLVRRQRFYVKLLLFTTPLSLPALLVYSGSGVTNYSCFHLVGLAILAVVTAKGALTLVRR